jgi:hypothetical protein
MAFRASPFVDSNAINSEASSIAPHSRHGSDGTTPSREGGEKEKHRFRSYRLVGTQVQPEKASDPQLMLQRYEQPWVGDKRMKKTRYNNLIVYLFMFIGLGVAGYICYTAMASVPKNVVRINTSIPSQAALTRIIVLFNS